MDELLTEFLLETHEGLDGLDRHLLDLERDPHNKDIINTIFRVVHTIKGTCGFLGLKRLEAVSHTTESVLGRLREGRLTVNPTVIGTLFAAVDRLNAIVHAVSDGVEDPSPHEDEAVIKALNACLSSSDVPEVPEEVKAIQKSDEQSTTTLASVGVDHNTAPTFQDRDTAPSQKQQFIRVNLKVLDNLMTLISELVLTRNQLLQIMQSSADSSYNIPLSRLSYITTELQEEVMKTRMQTIENAWATFPRLIHDLEHFLDKKIKLVQKGGDTELDRQVLELIKDPLTHMIRNSADHGLESGADRIKTGKPEHGTITLNAFHEGGQIVIEVIDDGAGIDPSRLRERLAQKGLASPEDIDAMSDWHVINQIFKPGFSTAEMVTNLSGRGVGMDVVKSNIEKLGGVIDLRSNVGQGTHFTIKIPLTLTIIPALIFKIKGERFAIHQLIVSELVRISKRSPHQIEYINKTPILRLRNGLLPLVFLDDLLNLEDDDKACDDGLHATHERCIIVVHIGMTMFGIVVDHVFDTQEIVVKPLSRLLNNTRFFSGSTILGDGGIVLIIDPNSIAYQFKEVTAKEADHIVDNFHFKTAKDKTFLLVFRVNGGHFAVPLALVSRIAEIVYKNLECVNETWMIHYQDHLLPVVKFEGNWTMDDVHANRDVKAPMLIFNDHGHAVGIVIDEILTIIEEKMDIELTHQKDGSLGTSIIGGKTTSIVDCEYYLKKAFPKWFEHRDLSTKENARKMRVLFVDDSAFFRNLILPVLTLSGFDVMTAVNGREALQICSERSDFDIIVTDIEMPEMNGADFIKEIRKRDAFKDMVVVALTSCAEKEDVERCLSYGFNFHFAKTQQKELLEGLSRMRELILKTEMGAHHAFN